MGNYTLNAITGIIPPIDTILAYKYIKEHIVHLKHETKAKEFCTNTTIYSKFLTG